MKNLVIAIFALLFSCYSYAGDILTLTNQMTFEGKVVKIKECEVIFKTDGKKFSIPSEDIFSIKFESITDKAYVDYMKFAERNPEACMKGADDAAMYHGKGLSHFALGFLFGPFAMIGTAIARPDPITGTRTFRKSQNHELFSDPDYLKCYRRKAKAGNIAMEGIGWGTWIFIALVAGGM
jgi:hypothetical protein